MKSFNGQIEIEVFSQLIETILYSRLIAKNGMKQQIKSVIEKLKGPSHDEGIGLHMGIEIISKIHEGCEFHVAKVLRKHFEDHHSDVYSIYLQIFTLHNKKAKQQDSSHFYRSENQLTQKWVFSKNVLGSKRLLFQKNEAKSDLFLHVLASLKEMFQTQNPDCNNTTEMDNNNKSYQIVIKSKCAKKGKFVTHVFHHQRNNHQPSLHTMHIKTSLLDLPKYWEKTLFIDQKSNVTLGCYLAQKTSQETMKINNDKQSPNSIEVAFLRQPDRKLSSQTKAEEKEKSSNSSFRFSLGLGDFPFSLNLNLNKGFKYSSAQIASRSKPSQEILHNHRPRYQSIYESRDQQMNIFILSPRKLSDQQSPKAKHLEQKTIKFEIDHHDHFSRGISQQVIQQFVLEPDENISNVSSDGFELLWQEGQGETDKVIQEENISDEKIKLQQKAIICEAIYTLEETFIESLKGLDNCIFLT